MQQANTGSSFYSRLTHFVLSIWQMLVRVWRFLTKPVTRVFWFYVNGFRSMTLGKTLWLIILLKLFIMFAVLKIFFFPNFLSQQGSNKTEKAAYVREQLIERGAEN